MTNVVISHSQEQNPDDKNHKELVMKVLVSLRFGNGDFKRGFEKTVLSAGIVDYQNSTELEIKLPSAPLIPGLYQSWQDKYSELVGTSGRKVLLNEPVVTSLDSGNIVRGFSQAQPTNLSYDECQEECNQYALDLCIQINQWLAVIKSQLETGFKLDADSDILLTINTEDITSQVTKDILHRLPWREWDYFNHNSTFEAVLCLSESKSNLPSVASVVDDGIFRRVRITSIFGDSTDIDIAGDRQLIAKLQKQGAELINLEQPQRQDFIKLWDEPCDILFYSGHSESSIDGTIGSLQISSTESLSLQEIRNTFNEAIKKGLKLAIFNSCDGLGLAKQLADLHLPYIIVWREPVPDKIAQRFLDYFLSSYAEGKSLFNSVRDARIKLVELTNSAEKEKHIPGLEWLPIICKNTTDAPPTWEDLGGLTGKLPDCPYQGLSAFGEEEKDFFFGRDDVIADLVGSVNSKPFVPVIGASGSGKSSVVFAGLVPQLKDISNVEIVSFRPGKNPFDALTVALSRIQNIQPSNHRLKELELAVNLQQDEQSLCKFIKYLKNLTPQPPSLQGNGENSKPFSMSFGHASLTQERGLERGSPQRFVIIADQFEELYTLTEESLRQPFLEKLLYAVQNAPAFTLVLTLRADFLGKALDYQPMGEAFKKYPPVLLTPMKPEDLLAAIEQPAAKLKVELEQGLTSKLIDDLGNQPGRLPLLEFTLSLLWEKHDKWYLTHKAYEEIGGLEKALAKYADGVLNAFSAVDKEKAERIFIQLIRPGEGTEDTKRKATRGEVGEDNWDLVEFLANKRLVVTGWDESIQQETVEIVHEALIREWGMLREWIKRNREFRIWQERLKPDVRQWENKKYDAQSLLQGTRLAIAQDWLKQRRDELTSVEQNFISASVKHRDKERSKQKRRRQLTVSGLVGGLMLVSTFAGISEIRRTDAEAGRISTVAGNFFTQNDHEVALTEAIKAGKLINQSIWKPWLAPEIRMQVISKLRQIVYEYQTKSFKGDSRAIYSINFSPDGKTIATASDLPQMIMWYIPTGQVISSATWSKRYSTKNTGFPNTNISFPHDGRITADVTTVSFSPNGKIVADGTFDGKIRLRDITTGLEINDASNYRIDSKNQHLKIFQEYSVPVSSINFSPNGQIIAHGSFNGTVKLRDINSGRLIKTFKEYSDPINSIVFSPNGKIIAYGSRDGTVRLQDITTGRLIKVFKSYFDISFSPNNKSIAFVSHDGKIKLWNIAERKEIKTLRKPSSNYGDKIIKLSFSPNGKIIAFASNGGILTLLDIVTGKEIKTVTKNFAVVTSLRFSPDGKKIAVASRDGKLILWDITTSEQIKTLKGNYQAINNISFSPDGKTIASASTYKRFDPTPSQDGKIKLWDSTTGKEIKTLKNSNCIADFNLSSDAKKIAFGSCDGIVKTWEFLKHTDKFLEKHSSEIRNIKFSPNGKIIASASNNGTVKLHNRNNQTINLNLKGHSQAVNSVSFSPDSETIVSGSSDKTLKLWDVTTGKEIKTLKGHSQAVNSVSFSPDGKTIVSGSSDKTLKLWDVTTGEEIKTLKGHSQAVNSVSFSPDGKTIVSGSSDKTLKLWDVTTGEEIKTLKGHSQAVNNTSFSSDGEIIVSTSGDGTIKLWEFSTGKEIKTLRGHYGKVNSFISPKFSIIISVSREGKMKLWVTDNKLSTTTKLYSESIIVPSLVDFTSVSFSPDGKRIASASDEGVVKLWNSLTGKEMKAFEGHSKGVNNVSFSPDGKTIVSASSDNTVKLWNITTEREITTLKGHSQWVNSVSFSPDGKTIASASGDKTVKLWDSRTGREIKSFQGHFQQVTSVSFSPDNKTIASASADKTIKLWDISTGREIKTFKGHSQWVSSVSFSPDNKTIASASDDGVKLWDINTGREITTLQGHSNQISSISFSPDGKTIASASGDGTIILWNFDLESLLSKGCNLIDDYLQNNPDVSESDKRVCDGINNRNNQVN